MHSQQQHADVGNIWFDKRRDLFMREMLDAFFRIIRSFQDIYLIYCHCRKSHNICGTELLSAECGERLDKIWELLTEYVGTEVEKGPLWRLKDLCHQIWPENIKEHEVNGSLIDWLAGSVFHEAMKLKENIYILNNYGPLAARIKNKPGAGSYLRAHNFLSPEHVTHLLDVQNVINRICADVINQMEQIAFLLGKAQYMLRLMLPALARNMLIVRLLAEREDVIFALWGESLEEIFADLFNDDPAAGFCAAGRSYHSGQWYFKALEMYRRALSLNRSCDEALVKVVQLQSVVDQNQKILGLA